MPSTRLPVGLPPLVCMKGLPATNVQDQLTPPSAVLGVPSTADALVGAAPLLVPLPPVLSSSSFRAPAASVTARSNVTLIDFTCDRCAAPSLTAMLATEG